MLMKAALIRRYGAADTIEITQTVAPTPKPDEVRIAVRASCATAASAMMRSGTPRYARLFLGLRGPRHPIPGSGFAGVVESIGADVTRFAVGDAVFGETAASFGTNAQFVCVPQDAVIQHKPDILSFQQAAVMSDGPLTSYNFLRALADVTPGQSVMIIGASGALGSAGVMIAKALGAHVTGVCSGANVDFVHDLGADRVIDYGHDDYTATGPYDVIYDTVGASSYRACRPALTARGVYMSPVLSMGLLWAMLRQKSPTRKQAFFSATGLKTPAELNPFMRALVKMVGDGKLSLPITQVFPLDQLAAAHAQIDTGRKRGAFVIAV